MPSESDKSPIKYCRIYQFLEKVHPDFAEVISALCLESALTAPKQLTGTTFLLPSKNTRDLLIKLRDTEPDRVEQIILALAIPEFIPNAGAIAERLNLKKQPIGCRLRKCLDFKVENGVGRVNCFKILGKNGEPDVGSKKFVAVRAVSEFQPLASKAGRLAILELTEDGIPVVDEVSYTPPDNVKIGGGKPAARPQLRLAFAISAEREYLVCIERGKCYPRHPILAKLVSLLNFLDITDSVVYDRACKILDYSPEVSFYLVLEPYKRCDEKDYIVPSALIHKWNNCEVFRDAVAEYKIHCEHGASLANCDGIKGKEAVEAKVKNYRADAIQFPGKRVADQINGIYAKVYGVDGEKRLWQDQFRHLFSAKFRHLCDYASHDGPDNTKIRLSRIIDEIRLSWPGNRYAEENILKGLKTWMYANHIYAGILRFVGSSDFLYSPCCAVPDAVADIIPPNSRICWDRNPQEYRRLEDFKSTKNEYGLPDDVIRSLEIYMKRNQGKLPEALVKIPVKEEVPSALVAKYGSVVSVPNVASV